MAVGVGGLLLPMGAGMAVGVGGLLARMAFVFVAANQATLLLRACQQHRQVAAARLGVPGHRVAVRQNAVELHALRAVAAEMLLVDDPAVGHLVEVLLLLQIMAARTILDTLAMRPKLQEPSNLVRPLPKSPAPLLQWALAVVLPVLEQSRGSAVCAICQGTQKHSAK